MHEETMIRHRPSVGDGTPHLKSLSKSNLKRICINIIFRLQGVHQFGF